MLNSIFKSHQIDRSHSISSSLDETDRHLLERQVRDAAVICIRIMMLDFPILCQMLLKLWKRNVDIVDTVPLEDILGVKILYEFLLHKSQDLFQNLFGNTFFVTKLFIDLFLTFIQKPLYFYQLNEFLFIFHLYEIECVCFNLDRKKICAFRF